MNTLAANIAPALARSFLAGEQSISGVIDRAAQTLGRPWPWLPRLANRYLAKYDRHTRPRVREVIEFVRRDRGFQLACSKHSPDIVIAKRIADPQQMSPARGATGWNIPEINSAGDLADYLALEYGELDWFADLKTLASHTGRSQLSHYHHRLLVKQWGTVRLIEAPKFRLKRIQRQVLTNILDHVPPHPSAHGFVQGRSVTTFAAPHVGQSVVLKMDLRDFFPSFSAARIQAFFRTAGYPESVADLLGGICTTATPRRLWAHLSGGVDPAQVAEARIRYSRRHLPQGAPTSPALANICAYRLDCRLTGLAAAAGANYTRYADDLAFSGNDDFERRCGRFSAHVGAVLLEEGFTPHYRKTRIMRKSVRQQIAGLVTNERINVARRDFDRLKAILTNCLRSGPESQNRDNHAHYRSHLEGRVSFVEMINPGKGARLRSLFEQIKWI